MFEEEDFQPMGYGYRLGSNPQTGNSYDASLEVGEQKCISMLREQEEELNKKARSSGDEVSTSTLFKQLFFLMYREYVKV